MSMPQCQIYVMGSLSQGIRVTLPAGVLRLPNIQLMLLSCAQNLGRLAASALQTALAAVSELPRLKQRSCSTAGRRAHRRAQYVDPASLKLWPVLGASAQLLFGAELSGQPSRVGTSRLQLHSAPL